VLGSLGEPDKAVRTCARRCRSEASKSLLTIFSVPWAIDPATE
jgi:hypothetical protein